MEIKVDDHRIVKDGSSPNLYLNFPMPFKQPGLFGITAEWCGYCKKLKASVEAAQQQVDFPFIFLDGGVEVKSQKLNETLTQLNVEYFPTLYYFDANGKLYPYKIKEKRTGKIVDGPRDTTGLITVFGKKGGNLFTWGKVLYPLQPSTAWD